MWSNLSLTIVQFAHRQVHIFQLDKREMLLHLCLKKQKLCLGLKSRLFGHCCSYVKQTKNKSKHLLDVKVPISES